MLKRRSNWMQTYELKKISKSIQNISIDIQENKKLLEANAAANLEIQSKLNEVLKSTLSGQTSLNALAPYINTIAREVVWGSLLSVFAIIIAFETAGHPGATLVFLILGLALFFVSYGELNKLVGIVPRQKAPAWLLPFTLGIYMCSVAVIMAIDEKLTNLPWSLEPILFGTIGVGLLLFVVYLKRRNNKASDEIRINPKVIV